MKHIHLIGVAGTGMGALAGLLSRAGYRVTGSDVAFYPPMGDRLAEWGVQTMRGFSAAHLEAEPDLVVVGNVCRRDNPEAQAALNSGRPYVSMPGALEQLFLSQRHGYVVAGTHGKTTTTALVVHLLQQAGREPGFLLGGVPQGARDSFALGAPDAPFVIEGDEYDSAFFEKQPKFYRYRPFAAIVTSLEHDHIDIYPTMETYRAAFEGFVERIPEAGLLVAFAGDPEVRRLAERARCRVAYYALDGDDVGDVTPTWLGALAPADASGQAFDLFLGGSSGGRVQLPLSGRHNARNALAALAMCAEGAGVPLAPLTRSLSSFKGVRRRQELYGVAAGVSIYDDFAHHPTAVRETLLGMRARVPTGGRLFAVFEPRSATASRRLHQEAYAHAFEAADWVLLSPVARKEIGETERLDVHAIAASLAADGKKALAFDDREEVLARLLTEARDGDVVVMMSNGDFGGLLDRTVAALTVRGPLSGASA